MSAGQLDMGKPLLFLKLLQFLFQLRHRLPGFQSGRTGYGAQQCPLIDGFALGAGLRSHVKKWVVDHTYYKAARQLQVFFMSCRCLILSVGRAGKMNSNFPKIDKTFNRQVDS